MRHGEGSTDAVTFEIIRHRLEYIARQMGSTLEAVGGTVTTTQMRDFISAIFTADGRIAAVGESLAMHVPPAGHAVRAIISKFEDDIHDGDAFVINDPYTASFHQSDVYVLSPIFYEGAIAFWAGSFVHVMDIGAMSPGGFSPNARSVYEEGLRLPGIRLVSSGRLARDLFEMMLVASRQPGMMGLDLKCQLAAHEVVRRELIRTLDEFSGPLVTAVAEGLIEFSVQELGQRLEAMRDGSWSERAVLVEPDVGRWQIHLRLHKEGCNLRFDFTGTDEQAIIGINLPLHATKGACFAALRHGVAYDLPKNEGLLARMVVDAPAGSLVASTPPAPVSLDSTSGAYAVKYAAQSVIAQMLGENPEWRDELFPPDPGGRRLVAAGVDQHGDYYAGEVSQPALGGGGASYSSDGLNSSPGDYRKVPNVEWIEMKAPLLFLYQRHVCDGAGAGRHRGGAGAEFAFTAYGIPHGMQGVGHGLAGHAGRGYVGGFPGIESVISLRSKCGIAETLARGRIPQSDEELVGDIERVGYREFEFGNDDLVYVRLGQGGGFGDPLERQPEDVALDCERGIVSRTRAESTYGVVLDDALEPIPSETAATRETIRRSRLYAAPVDSVTRRLEWGILAAQEVAVRGPEGSGYRCGGCGGELTSGSSRARWIRTDIAGRPMVGTTDAPGILTAICGGCGRSIGSQQPGDTD